MTRTDGLDREAVLLAWERKIEQEERRGPRTDEGGRFVREQQPEHKPEPRSDRKPGRFERHGGPPVRSASPPAKQLRPAAASAGPAAAPRRTVTITGQPTPARRRRATVAERHIAAQPDRIALWAFLLGLFLVAVAAGTAQA